MRSVISFDAFVSSDVKPNDLYREYAALTEKDIASLLLPSTMATAMVCPACLSDAIMPAFNKLGLQYMECGACSSLFTSSRPAEPLLRDYYAQSKAEKFWHQVLVPASAKVRNDRIVQPRLAWLSDYASGLSKTIKILDIHSHQDGWLAALAASNILSVQSKSHNMLLSPLLEVPADLNACFSVLDDAVVDLVLDEPVDMITMFDVVDRTGDVDALFQCVARNLKVGGLCLITSILGSGYEIQTLWDQSESLLPPDRLNALSVEGFEQLFARHGFKTVEFSTPGGLDMDIIDEADSLPATLNLPRALTYFLRHRSDAMRDSFQQFLQSALLSSSGRMVIRKI